MRKDEREKKILEGKVLADSGLENVGVRIGRPRGEGRGWCVMEFRDRFCLDRSLVASFRVSEKNVLYMRHEKEKKKEKCNVTTMMTKK